MPAARAAAASRKTSRGCTTLAVERADGQHRRPDEAVLRVEQHDAELLDGAGAELRQQVHGHFARRQELRAVGRLPQQRAPAEFDRREDLRGLRLADARACAASRRQCTPAVRGGRPRRRARGWRAPGRRPAECRTRARARAVRCRRARPRRGGRVSPAAGPARPAASQAGLQRRQNLGGAAAEHESGVRRQRRVVDVDLDHQGSCAPGRERETRRRVDQRRRADGQKHLSTRSPPRTARRAGPCRAPRRTTRCLAAVARRTRTPAAARTRPGRRPPVGPALGRHEPASAGAPGPPDIAVQLDHVPAARALVQSVHVLRDQRETPGSCDWKRARARCPGLGCARPTMPCRHRYHCQTRRGIACEGLGRGQIGRAVVPPQPVRRLETWVRRSRLRCRRRSAR